MKTSLPSPDRPFAGLRGLVVAFSHYPWDPRIRRETEALAEAGMTMDLFCLAETDAEPRDEFVGAANVHRLRLRHTRGGTLRYFFEYGVFFAWCFWRLSLAGLRRRHALVHVHNVPDVLVFTSLVPWLRGAHVVLDLHDPMPELLRTIFRLGPRHPFVRLLLLAERASIAFAHLVLTPNLRFRVLFEERCRHAGKVKVVMNSPADDLFHLDEHAGAAPRPPRAGATFRLMYHGLIAERHGLDVLLRAVKIVSRSVPQVRLDIYGARNPYLEVIEAKIAELQLGDRVRYHGKKSLAEIAAIIPTVDLGIVPNRRTPFTELNMPTRIFEYLALRKPVVTLNTAGVRDYFRPDEIFYFEADDPLALARVIQRVHDQPDLTAAVVERGYRIYEQHRWASEKERFLSHVAQLVGRRRAAPAAEIEPPADLPSAASETFSSSSS